MVIKNILGILNIIDGKVKKYDKKNFIFLCDWHYVLNHNEPITFVEWENTFYNGAVNIIIVDLIDCDVKSKVELNPKYMDTVNHILNVYNKQDINFTTLSNSTHPFFYTKLYDKINLIKAAKHYKETC